MRSPILYKFSCLKCTSEYVGMTTPTLGTRADEHAGVSFRTGAPVGNAMFALFF